SSKTAKPADPNHSYSATCGFSAATPVVSAAAWTTVFENVSSPPGSSLRPQACNNSPWGSIPKHSGPWRCIARAKRAPNVCDISLPTVDLQSLRQDGDHVPADW